MFPLERNPWQVPWNHDNNTCDKTHMTATQPTKVVLLYKRDSQPDESLMRFIEDSLSQKGYSVFIDRHLNMGVEWAREIEQQIRSADAVITLLSSSSIYSEMLGFEIEIAHEAGQLHEGHPRLLPVRVQYTGPLPEPLASILDPIQYFLWEEESDNLGLITEMLESLKGVNAPEEVAEAEPPPAKATPTPKPPSPKPSAGFSRPPALESMGGAVPLNSEYYVTRPVDGELHAAIDRGDSIILIKGARQMGKTSLLARGLQHTRECGSRAVSTDFQKFNAACFTSVDKLYQTLAESLVDQLDLPTQPAEVWDKHRGPNANLERFVRREVLAHLDKPLAWGLDEVDRLFATPFGSEFFGLVRSWHNERALDPAGPWGRLTLAIAYATEAHLFISDMNQSPFNVGTRLALEDFTAMQTAELNRRYQNAIKSQDDLTRFARLVSGHPYLVRRGLHELAACKMSFDAFEEQAPSDSGIYGDHLRRVLVLLARDPSLANVMRGIMAGEPCPTPESFYRLRSAGLITGHTPEEARPRCRLYTMYLRRHLG